MFGDVNELQLLNLDDTKLFAKSIINVVQDKLDLGKISHKKSECT